MKTINLKSTFTRVSELMLIFAFAHLSYAQSNRTWVSSLGSDSNACSRTSPCLTFIGALAKTASGGEIDVLDPGDYGAVTITKSVTIDGGGGQVAAVLGPSTAWAGFYIEAGPTDVVTLRNLRIKGTSSHVGISLKSGGVLHVENCDLYDWVYGIVILLLYQSTPVQVTVENTVIHDNSWGIDVGSQTAGIITVDIHHTRISNSSEVGVEGGDNSVIVVRDSEITHSGIDGVNQYLVYGGKGSKIAVVGSTLAFNPTALRSDSGSYLMVSGNVFTGNGTMFDQNGGQIYSYGDNTYFGNSGFGASVTTLSKM